VPWGAAFLLFVAATAPGHAAPAQSELVLELSGHSGTVLVDVPSTFIAWERMTSSATAAVIVKHAFGRSQPDSPDQAAPGYGAMAVDNVGQNADNRHRQSDAFVLGAPPARLSGAVAIHVASLGSKTTIRFPSSRPMHYRVHASRTPARKPGLVARSSGPRLELENELTADPNVWVVLGLWQGTSAPGAAVGMQTLCLAPANEACSPADSNPVAQTSVEEAIVGTVHIYEPGATTFKAGAPLTARVARIGIGATHTVGVIFALRAA